MTDLEKIMDIIELKRESEKCNRIVRTVVFWLMTAALLAHIGCLAFGALTLTLFPVTWLALLFIWMGVITRYYTKNGWWT